jgi:hypothetical protein
MARKGEKLITETELESRLRKVESKLNGVLSFLVFNGGNEIKNFMFQSGAQVFASGGTAVTFGKPYKLGSTPLVFMTPNTNQTVYASVVSATGFTGHNTGSASARWIAIGERG